MLKKWFQAGFYKIVSPIVGLVVRLGVTPNMITLLGVLANVVALYFFWKASQTPLRFDAFGALATAAGWVLLGGIFDVLDGRVARITGSESQAGALFDSVLDRYAEWIMFLGFGLFARFQAGWTMELGVFIALMGSVMVSYTRARVEGLQGPPLGGLFQRPERIVTLGVGALIVGLLGLLFAIDDQLLTDILEGLVWVVAAGAMSTAAYRFRAGYRSLKRTL